MVAIPKDEQQETIDRIYKAIEKRNEKPLRFSRLGASAIGTECTRAIWYGWRGAKRSTTEGRVYRIFETGHSQEDRVIQDLKDAKFEVFHKDATGKQFEYTTEDGHFICKIDGVIVGVVGAEKTPHVLEIKSSNLRGYEDLKKIGVKASKPVHYAQMQMGMELSDLERALYVVICKDNEQYYIERVRRDDSYIQELKNKLKLLTEGNIPPPRIAERENDWRCKFCDYTDICWESVPMEKHCRTCDNVAVLPDGIWGCNVSGDSLSVEEQVKGCEHYRL